jgi:clan AA aspartic protease (TIGR02281 family)
MMRQLKFAAAATVALCLAGSTSARAETFDQRFIGRFGADPAPEDVRVTWRLARPEPSPCPMGPCPPTLPKADRATPPPPTKISVPLTPFDGVFQVYVALNGTVNVDMLLDSGATDVQVSEEVFSRLQATGAVKTGEKHYRIANGTTIRRDSFTIASLKIGDVVIHDVEANVGPGPLLLGQAFLKRLGSWSIDNKAGVLILETTGGAFVVIPAR